MAAQPAPTVHITAESGSDRKLSSFIDFTPSSSQPMGSTTSMSYVYSTQESFTLDGDADLIRYHATASAGPPYHFPAAGESIITYMEFGPNPEQEEGFWHRTHTVDYIVIIEGELELSLNGGEQRIVRKGDVVVQRAPMHKWKNASRTEIAKFIGVLLGAAGAVQDEVEFRGEQ
ncbi:cupin domain-containing protein [Sarocladium implicatum]|nr:cupin domain-containing protein [Sarocladium implicatum]